MRHGVLKLRKQITNTELGSFCLAPRMLLMSVFLLPLLHFLLPACSSRILVDWYLWKLKTICQVLDSPLNRDHLDPTSVELTSLPCNQTSQSVFQCLSFTYELGATFEETSIMRESEEKTIHEGENLTQLLKVQYSQKEIK